MVSVVFEYYGAITFQQAWQCAWGHYLVRGCKTPPYPRILRFDVNTPYKYWDVNADS